MKEGPELDRYLARHEVEEHMAPAKVARGANWQLVWKGPNGLPVTVPECQMRMVSLLQVGVQHSADEVLQLVVLGSQPGLARVGQDRVQNHQPLDHATERRGLPVAVVLLANCFVHRLVRT